MGVMSQAWNLEESKKVLPQDLQRDVTMPVFSLVAFGRVQYILKTTIKSIHVYLLEFNKSLNFILQHRTKSENNRKVSIGLGTLP